MKVLVKIIAGSHLFGTNTPESDKDYKGVYLPSKEGILLGDYKESISDTTGSNNSKNSKEDVDVEMFSLKKFIKMVERGDTGALEILFAPEEFILEKDPSWDLILKKRDLLVSKKITALIGYARQQANKYGIKGSRMGELNRLIKFLKDTEKNLLTPGSKLKHAWDYIVEESKNYNHVNIITLQVKSGEIKQVPALEVLGKKFDHHCKFSHILEILNKVYKNYGSRAREAKSNGGIDWKALSHAARVMYQGEELLKTGKITLPLPEPQRSYVVFVYLI